MLSMHELSLRMPEPMLSLSMLILATYPEAALVLRHADPVRPRTMFDAVPRIPRTALDAVTRVPRTASRDEVQDWAQIIPKSSQNSPNHIKSPKANMLKFGDVSFDLGFERGRMSATGYVAKISMLRLNIGSGMLRLSSCMLSIGRGP